MEPVIHRRPMDFAIVPTPTRQPGRGFCIRMVTRMAQMPLHPDAVAPLETPGMTCLATILDGQLTAAVGAALPVPGRPLCQLLQLLQKHFPALDYVHRYARLVLRCCPKSARTPHFVKSEATLAYQHTLKPSPKRGALRCSRRSWSHRIFAGRAMPGAHGSRLGRLHGAGGKPDAWALRHGCCTSGGSCSSWASSALSQTSSSSGAARASITDAFQLGAHLAAALRHQADGHTLFSHRGVPSVR